MITQSLVNSPILIYNLDYDQIFDLIQAWGEPAYRASQIWKGIYQHHSNNALDNTPLPLILRSRLAEMFSFKALTPLKSKISKDAKTQKILFQTPDKYEVESVLMTYNRGHTLCVSTQSGCAMACIFCATGQMGFNRNLTSGEIIEQVMFFSRQLSLLGQRPSNIVFMGMGEPFLNYEATIDAIHRLNHPLGYNFGERRFTVSTVGIIPKIKRFTQEGRQINLAISLHSTDNDLRSQLLPINKKYPVEDLLEACREYVNFTKRRITFEWALIEDLNDHPDHANDLARKIKGLTCHVNIIPLNPTSQFEGRPSSYQRAVIFKKVLETHSIPCTIRLKKGLDINAGCGQLSSRYARMEIK